MPIINIPDIISNTKAAANDINSRIAKIVDVLNGNLDSSNLANNAVTRGKIATEAVTQDNIDWDGQGIIFHQEVSGRNTQAVPRNSDTNWTKLPSFTVPLRAGYSYKIYVQSVQIGQAGGQPSTLNMWIADGSTDLGRGTVQFPDGNSSYQDPTISVSAYFRATTTANKTLNIKVGSNHATGSSLNYAFGKAYILVECVGKVNV